MQEVASPLILHSFPNLLMYHFPKGLAHLLLTQHLRRTQHLFPFRQLPHQDTILKATDSYLSFLQRLQRYLFSKRDKNLQLLRPLSLQTAGWYITLSNVFSQASCRDLNSIALSFLYNLIHCQCPIKKGKEKETIILFKTLLNSSISFSVYFSLIIYTQRSFIQKSCFKSFFLLGI